MIYIYAQNLKDFFRIYRISLLFKDIICFYVALYKEPYTYYFNENKNFSFLHIKIYPTKFRNTKNTKNHISGIRALRFKPVKMEEDDDEGDEDEEKEETMKSTTHDHDCIFIVKM